MVFAIHQHELIICIHVFPHPEAPSHLRPHPILLLLLLSRCSRVWLCASPLTAAHQAPLSLGFSRQEHWSGLPFPPPMHESEKWKWSSSVLSDSSLPHGLLPTRLLRPWDSPGKSPGVGCHRLLLPIPLGCPKALVLGVPLHALNSHWSSVLHVVMHMFQCFPLKSFHPCLLPLSPKACSLHLCLPCCPAFRILSTVFLNSMYIH